MAAEILAVGDVARLLGVSPDRARQIERSGQLPAERTPGGVRVFRRADVDRLLERRQGSGREVAHVTDE